MSFLNLFFHRDQQSIPPLLSLSVLVKKPRREASQQLQLEALEDRTMPSASILGFNSITGAWKIGVPTSSNTFEVSTAAHWDPYRMLAVVEGDFNGDGQTDVAGWSFLGYSLVGLADGTQFQTEQWSDGFRRGARTKAFLVGDFNDDGLDDVAMFTGSGAWWVALSTGSSFDMQRWDQPDDWHSGKEWRDWEVGDFNDDGMADVAGLTRQGSWQVGLSTGTSFTAQTWLPKQTWADGPYWKRFAIGDFNGDGLTDIAGLQTSGQCFVALSTGSSFTSQAWGELPTIGSWSVMRAGDFNGDGNDDVALLDGQGNTWVGRSTGSAFVFEQWAANSITSGRPIRLNAGDFNGDGNDDLAILTSKGDWQVGVSSGTQFDYSSWGQFGRGSWVYTFATGSHTFDQRVNHHGTLRARSAANYITTADMANLRKDPTYFETIFQAYKYRLRKELGSRFGELDDHGLAFTLATIVAYQAAYYRGFNDPQGYFPPPNGSTLPALLRVPKLVCNEYCYLATELYHVAFPVSGDTDTNITQVGWNGGPFGNHAQLIFTHDGVSLLGDPTLGLVALTDFAHLRSGQHLSSSYVKQLIYHREVTSYMQGVMASFRSKVVGAIVGGQYPQETLIYYRNVSRLD